MNDILDDFSDIYLRQSRVQYYFVYTVFILLLMNGAAYLQETEQIQFTPIFGQYWGMLSALLLLLSTALCYRKVIHETWLKSIFIGLLIMVICFTLIFQIVDQLEPSNSSQLFPFWSYLSLGYSFISIAVMEFWGRRADSKYNAK